MGCSRRKRMNQEEEYKDQLFFILQKYQPQQVIFTRFFTLLDDPKIQNYLNHNYQLITTNIDNVQFYILKTNT